MNGLLIASPLMTAAEVQEWCKQARENLDLLLDREVEIKQKLFVLNSKVAG